MKTYCSSILLSQPESDGSRSGSSLSLRNIPPAGAATTGGTTTNSAQSPSHGHRGVHRSISATNAKPSRRASSGGESLRESPASGKEPAVTSVAGGGPTCSFCPHRQALAHCRAPNAGCSPHQITPYIIYNAKTCQSQFNNNLYVDFGMVDTSFGAFLSFISKYILFKII
jgi:hypothetical protein